MNRDAMNVAIIGCGLIGNTRAKALRRATSLVVSVDFRFGPPRLKNSPLNIRGAKRRPTSQARPSEATSITGNCRNKTNDVLASAKRTPAVKSRQACCWLKKTRRRAMPMNCLPVEKIRERTRRHCQSRIQSPIPSGAAEGSRDLHKPVRSGPLMFIRGRYGHGGRLGMEKEWARQSRGLRRRRDARPGRSPLSISPAGSSAILRPPPDASKNYFWNWPVEDNGFRDASHRSRPRWLGCTPSCSEWKKPLLIRDLRKSRQAAHRRPRRKLRRRASGLLQNAPPDGPRPKQPSGNTPGDDTRLEGRVPGTSSSASRPKPNPAETSPDAIAAMRIVEFPLRAIQSNNDSLTCDLAAPRASIA